MQTYILEDDETGKLVSTALIEAAKRNVKIYVLVDGYASQHLSDQFITDLTSTGIHFRFFEPLFKSENFYFGRRLHSKVIVVDSQIAIAGGVNITNRYNDLPGQPAWLDFALLVEGPAATDTYNVCVYLWNKNKSTTDAKLTVDTNKIFTGAESSLVRLRRNDWLNKRLEISNSYLEMFKTANKHITILSSYALPGNIFRKNLEKAIKRGVKVRMIVSARSDVFLVKTAEKYWYDWLLRNNIEIFEYTRNVLHGKLATCDGEWMTIGSYNVNDLSAYVSVELNYDVKDRTFVSSVDKVLAQIVDADCIAITKSGNQNTSLLKRISRWTAYNIIRGVFSIFTFYYKQQR